MVIDFGRIYLCIGPDITWCSKRFPFDDDESRMFPAIHFLVSHLNIEHRFKNILKKKTGLNKGDIYIRGIHLTYSFRA